MRTLDEIKYDKLRISNCGSTAKEALVDYIDTMTDIHNRSTISSATKFNAERIKELQLAKELLTEEIDPSRRINVLLSLFASTVPMPLKEGTHCPKCNEPFPGDIWEWYSELYCPYCGQKLQCPPEAEEELAAFAIS